MYKLSGKQVDDLACGNGWVSAKKHNGITSPEIAKIHTLRKSSLCRSFCSCDHPMLLLILSFNRCATIFRAQADPMASNEWGLWLWCQSHVTRNVLVRMWRPTLNWASQPHLSDLNFLQRGWKRFQGPTTGTFVIEFKSYLSGPAAGWSGRSSWMGGKKQIVFCAADCPENSFLHGFNKSLCFL